MESLAAAVVPGFVALERHPDVEVRTRAVELLARRPEPEAQAAVIDALADADEGVRRTALSAIGPVKQAPTIAAVARLLQTSTSWPLRVRASEALGRLGQGGADPAAVETLAAAAKTDSYALVRESAVRALAPPRSRPRQSGARRARRQGSRAARAPDGERAAPGHRRLDSMTPLNPGQDSSQGEARATRFTSEGLG